MALTVLNVAFPFAPVGPAAVGGAEQILTALDAGLTRRGHRSLVIACEGSQVQGTLFATPAPGERIDRRATERAWALHRLAIEEVLRSTRVDVVHFHGLDFHAYLPDPLPPAALATLHLPPGWYDDAIFALPERGVELVCVSDTQRASCPAHARIVATIPNGVAVEAFHGAVRRLGFVAMLARVCPEKGFHLALEAARRADVPLLMAGRVFGYPAHQRYFDEEIAPMLDRRRRFIGPVGPRARRRLLGLARALLVPSLAPETSSLVTMEALASGTPVIAFRHGALPELIDHGVTGFLVDDLDGMVEALSRIDEIDPKLCRAHARLRFSVEAMIARYLVLYAQLAERARTAAARVAPSLSPGSVGLRAERVDDRAGLQKLEPQWRALWRRALGATPFNHPDWLIPWCVHFGRRAVNAVALFRGDTLVALAPLEVWNEGGVRVLKFLGAGISDALDVLVDGDDAAALTRALWAALMDDKSRFDLCELSPVPADSPLRSAALPARWTRCEVSPQLHIVGGRSLEEVVPRPLCTAVRYNARRLQREAGVRFESATEDTAPKFVEALAALHRARWARRGEPGVLADPPVAAFHREVAPRFARLGMLRMEALRVDQAFVGVLYAFSARRRCHYYLSGFDPTWERRSPGSVLIGRAIEWAMAAGDQFFDFLRGAEPYKYRWGATDRPLWQCAFEAAVAQGAAR